MRTMIWIFVILTFMNSSVFAIESATINEGAQQYDWQTCVDSKSNECINACQTSENLDCKDNCISVAKDKCRAEGIYPPAGATIDQ